MTHQNQNLPEPTHFATQLEAYQWIVKNIKVGESKLIRLEILSYQKVWHLAQSQPGCYLFRSAAYGQRVYEIKYLKKLEKPKQSKFHHKDRYKTEAQPQKKYVEPIIAKKDEPKPQAITYAASEIRLKAVNYKGKYSDADYLGIIQDVLGIGKFIANKSC